MVLGHEQMPPPIQNMLRRIEKSQGCHTPRLDGVHRFVPVEGER